MKAHILSETGCRNGDFVTGLGDKTSLFDRGPVADGPMKPNLRATTGRKGGSKAQKTNTLPQSPGSKASDDVSRGSGPLVAGRHTRRAQDNLYGPDTFHH
jgi:hypothetical protein